MSSRPECSGMRDPGFLFFFSFLCDQKRNKKRRFLRGIFVAHSKEFSQATKPSPKLSVELRSPGILSFCSTILAQKGEKVKLILINIIATCLMAYFITIKNQASSRGPRDKNLSEARRSSSFYLWLGLAQHFFMVVNSALIFLLRFCIKAKMKRQRKTNDCFFLNAKLQTKKNQIPPSY